jgi:hypothetical protein
VHAHFDVLFVVISWIIKRILYTTLPDFSYTCDEINSITYQTMEWMKYIWYGNDFLAMVNVETLDAHILLI